MSVYIYAITAADHPRRLEGLKGVGEPAGALRTVVGGPLAAVVSDAPAELRAKRRDLLAHQTVLERLIEDGAALPMRFGLTAAGDQEIADALVREADSHLERLRQLHGCVEYNLKVRRDEDDLLRQIVGESQEVRRLNAVTRAVPADRDSKVALGELISQEVRAHQDGAAAEVVESIAPAARRHTVVQPTEGHFLNVSFLVERARAEDFSRAVRAETERRGEAYDLTVRGPLPPYSFV